MNKELIDFIEICLQNNLISEKERKVIFKKADDLGVSEDEWDIIIDSLTQKKLNANNEIETKPYIEKRKFKKKQSKSIPPAKLDMELKIREGINTLEKNVEKLIKEKDDVNIQINNSFKILNEKRDILKEELQTFRLNFNKDLKKYLNLFFNSIGREISNEFGETSIILDQSKKYDFNNLDYSHITNLFEKKDSNGDKVVSWDSTVLDKKNHLRKYISYIIGYGGIIASFLLFYMNNGYSFHLFLENNGLSIVDEFKYGEFGSGYNREKMRDYVGYTSIILFFIFLGITYLGKYFKNQSKKNTMNFSLEDVLTIVEKIFKKNKSKIDELNNKNKIISETENIFNYKRKYI